VRVGWRQRECQTVMHHIHLVAGSRLVSVSQMSLAELAGVEWSNSLLGPSRRLSPVGTSTYYGYSTLPSLRCLPLLKKSGVQNTCFQQIVVDAMLIACFVTLTRAPHRLLSIPGRLNQGVSLPERRTLLEDRLQEEVADIVGRLGERRIALAWRGKRALWVAPSS
jgi:hypothetical protein